MMMNSPNTPTLLRGRRKRRVSLPLALGVLLLVAVLAAAALWRGPAGEALWRVLAPVVALRNAIGGGEVTELRGEVAALTARVADRDILAEENAALKARLGRTGEAPRVLAGILQRPPGSAYDTFVIDAGQTEGIAAGMRVSAGGSTVVGEVEEVYAARSRVVLYSAPGLEFDSLLYLDGTALPIVVVGTGGGGFKAEVPAGTRAKVGDSIVLPGVLSTLVATVVEIDAADGESFATLYLHMPVNIFQLQHVEVLTY